MSSPEITPAAAGILGFVEGLTEYLPISSTGHLILACKWLGLDLESKGVDGYIIVIQAGALLSVVALYFPSIMLMLRGLAGRSPEGLRLVGLLLLSFTPAVVFALLLDDFIHEKLFRPTPVAIALGIGGAAMIYLDNARRRSARLDAAQADSEDVSRNLYFANLTWRMALIIGFAQALALWPGTSRSMVTIMAGVLVGLSPRSAAEYSFLLALPTLGAASIWETLHKHDAMLEASGPVGLGIGFFVSFVVAALAIKYFLHYLTRHGLALFGWYRIALAAIVLYTW